MIKAKQNCNNSFVLTWDNPEIVVSGSIAMANLENEDERYRTYEPALRIEKNRPSMAKILDQLKGIKKRISKRKYAKKIAESLASKKIQDIKDQTKLLRSRLNLEKKV